MRSARADLAGAEVGAWQRECAALIGQLSGGSKSHWLSRAYSDAFLVPAPAATGGAPAIDGGTILARVLSVLERAMASLASMAEADAGPAADASASGAERFAFLDDPALRAGVVQADAEAEAALRRGAFALSLVSTCSVLEAILTDALERSGHPAAADETRPLHERSFEQRIADAERTGVISAGCRRLPAVARDYRGLLTSDGSLRPDAAVSQRDAVRARQVLRVIARDRVPGR